MRTDVIYKECHPDAIREKSQKKKKEKEDVREDAGITEDGFLNRCVLVLQPKRGYRAAIDSVLLAAAIQCQEGERLHRNESILCRTRKKKYQKKWI